MVFLDDIIVIGKIFDKLFKNLEGILKCISDKIQSVRDWAYA